MTTYILKILFFFKKDLFHFMCIFVYVYVQPIYTGAHKS